MSLVVVAKCIDGLVLAADSRAADIRYETVVSERDKVKFVDGVRKLFSFRAPYDNVAVLLFDFLAINEELPGLDFSTQMKRYSIDVCIRRFRKQLYNTQSRNRITVQEFKRRLEVFLIEYWQYYRERRHAYLDKTNARTFEVKLLVAGFNDGDRDGHVFPILLTDDDKEWNGSRYGCMLDYVELIPRPCGIYCDGVTDFAIPILVADDPMDSIKGLQQDNIETTVAEIADLKKRFSVSYVQIPNQRPFFFGSDIPIHDGMRIAELLIRGTADYLGDRGGVGGATRICTINPLRGTKCRSRA